MSFIDDIFNIVTNITGVLTDLDDAITEGFSLSENIRAEARHLREIEINPKWKTRVINVPAAFDQTKTFVTDMTSQISDAFHSLISNLRSLRGFVHGVGHIPPDPRGGGQGVIRILEDITSIRNAINEVKLFFVNLNSFVDAMRQIRDEIEGFDTLFLQQGNSRFYIHTTGGDRLKLRTGALHEHS